MINKILEPEERVYIKNYSQAEFFFEFYKNECGAQHSYVNKGNWVNFPYFQLDEDREIVGWRIGKDNKTYEFEEWLALIGEIDSEDDSLLQNCDLI